MTFFAARREIKVQRKTICKSPKKKEHRSHFITFREQKNANSFHVLLHFWKPIKSPIYWIWCKLVENLLRKHFAKAVNSKSWHAKLCLISYSKPYYNSIAKWLWEKGSKRSPITQIQYWGHKNKEKKCVFGWQTVKTTIHNKHFEKKSLLCCTTQEPFVEKSVTKKLQEFAQVSSPNPQ